MLGTTWFVFILFFLGMYVVLDGYDLGIGILSLLERDETRQRTMLGLVATVWDGNESWLILFGVGIWAGFPAVYGTALPAVFLPLVIMLFGLIFRGVAVEMAETRSKAEPAWRLAFGVGSLMAALAQGVALGGILSGVHTKGSSYVGHSFDFFNGFSCITGLSAVVLYMAAGAAMLQLKADGDLHRRVSAAGPVTVGFAAVLVTVSALTLAATKTHVHLANADRVWPFTVLCVLAAVSGITAWRTFGKRPDWRPFVAIVTAEASGLAALAVAVYPQLVPPGITVASAKSPSSSLTFLVIGIGINIPFVLFYNFYGHRAFRGKLSGHDPEPLTGGSGLVVPVTEPVAS